MKKIFLTFAALAFGATISFAQTNQENEQEHESDKLEIERLSNTAEATGKKKIEMSELPLQVQEAFQKSEYKDWEVAEIYEIEEAAQGWVDEDIPLEEGQTEASLNSDYSYEIVLLSQDMKDEVEDSQEAVADEQEDALEEEDVAVSTETVKVEVPALILHFDQEGKLLQKQDQEGSNPAETEEY